MLFPILAFSTVKVKNDGTSLIFFSFFIFDSDSLNFYLVFILTANVARE